MAPSTGPARAVDGLIGLEHGHRLVDEVRDVLRVEDVADLGIGGHDHAGRSIGAGQPRALVVGDLSVVVVVDLFAEIPDRSVIGLRVEVERDLDDPAAAVGDVLRHDRLDLVAVDLDHPRLGQQRDLDAQGVAGLGAELDDLRQVADREERVGDVGRVREDRRLGVHLAAGWCADRGAARR